MANLLFTHPHTLLDKVGKTIAEVGSEKFFTSSSEEVKKAREGFAAYFFTLALKQWTGRDWWLAQYDQAERQCPDFDFFSFGEEPNPIRVEKVELVGVYPHFKTFEEMVEVIEKKQKQYGNSSLDFSLLIFVNHEKSEEWIQALRGRLKLSHPFISIWTIHLRFKKGGKEVGKAVAHRIHPTPQIRVEADTDDPNIHKRQPLPTYLVESKSDGSTNLSFKRDFIEKFIERGRMKKAP
jgi:hypothetical protein